LPEWIGEEIELGGAGPPEGGGGESGAFGRQAAPAACDGKKASQLLGPDAFATEPESKAGIVELAAMQGADAVEDFLLFLGLFAGEPIGEDIGDGEGQPERFHAGPLGASLGGGGDYSGDFMVCEPWDDGRHENADRHAVAAESCDGIEPPGGARSARLEAAQQIAIERSDREGDRDSAVAGQIGQEIDVAGDEGVFGDQTDGVAAGGEDLEAMARDLEPALDWLVRICHAAQRESLRGPAARGQLATEERGGVGFNQDPGLEVEPGGEPEVFVCGAGEAVGTAVLAAAVWVDAG